MLNLGHFQAFFPYFGSYLIHSNKHGHRFFHLERLVDILGQSLQTFAMFFKAYIYF